MEKVIQKKAIPLLLSVKNNTLSKVAKFYIKMDCFLLIVLKYSQYCSLNIISFTILYKMLNRHMIFSIIYLIGYLKYRELCTFCVLKNRTGIFYQSDFLQDHTNSF